jgi:hypothetical protein
MKINKLKQEMISLLKTYNNANTKSSETEAYQSLINLINKNANSNDIWKATKTEQAGFSFYGKKYFI